MKILNFGSLNIDYVYEVPRVVAPGETIGSGERKIFSGGKGLNRAIALAKAGVPVFHAGSIGFGGEILVETLKQAGVRTDFVYRQSVPGGHTIIQVDASGQNSIIVYGGTNKMISRAHIDRVFSSFGRGDLLLLENEINEVSYIIRSGRARDMTVLFNPSPYDDSVRSLPLEQVDCFIVNEIEGSGLSETNRFENIIPKLTKRYPGAHILLTMGPLGAKYSDGEMMYHQNAFPVNVADTTAAGDTFLGYFVYGLTAGLSPQETLRVAAKAASIAVSRRGAADSIPLLQEVIGEE